VIDLFRGYSGASSAYEVDFRECFMRQFCEPLAGASLDTALRHFISKFSLPRDPARIDRIMEDLAKAFHERNPHAFDHADTVHILLFSLLMLSVDAHNEYIKPQHRLNCENYIRNLTGITIGGGSVDRSILVGMYERVTALELGVLPRGEQHVQREGWLTLLSTEPIQRPRPSPGASGWRRGVALHLGHFLSRYQPRRYYAVMLPHVLYLFATKYDETPLVRMPLGNMLVGAPTSASPRAFSLHPYPLGRPNGCSTLTALTVEVTKRSRLAAPLLNVANLSFAAADAAQAHAWTRLLREHTPCDLLHGGPPLVQAPPPLPPTPPTRQTPTMRPTPSRGMPMVTGALIVPFPDQRLPPMPPGGARHTPTPDERTGNPNRIAERLTRSRARSGSRLDQHQVQVERDSLASACARLGTRRNHPMVSAR